MSSLLLPGDVLIVRKEYALTNYFLPGYWPHAALYLGTAPQLAAWGLSGGLACRPQLARLAGAGSAVVLEALKDGVQLRTLDSPFGVDSIIVLRPRLAPA